jgi:hypothetical protein
MIIKVPVRPSHALPYTQVRDCQFSELAVNWVTRMHIYYAKYGAQPPGVLCVADYQPRL